MLVPHHNYITTVRSRTNFSSSLRSHDCVATIKLTLLNASELCYTRPAIQRPAQKMSFRFNVDLSFDFPRPPPRGSSTQGQIASSPSDGHGPQSIKPGVRGWLQTARQHPRYSLRLLYFIACIIGLILNAIVVNSIWSYRIVDVATGAFSFVRYSS